MTITKQDRQWLDQRDSLTATEKQAIDFTFDEMYRYTGTWDIPAAGDDRAASLESALVRYFIESRSK